MKLLSTWFASILIASALLLSAENPRAQQSPNPVTKNEAEKPNDHNQIGQTIQPLPSKAISPSATRTMSQSIPAPQRPASKTEENQYGRFWIVVVGLIVAAASWLGANPNTIFNGLLALFTFLLYKVSNQQKELMKNAEAISHRSVEVAENSLDIYRPFLLVTNVVVEVKHSDYVSTADIQIRHNFSFKIALKNFGVSPADIIDYTAAVEPLDPPKPPKFIDPPIWYGELEHLNEPVIGPGEPVADRIHTGNGFTDREYQLLVMQEKRLAIYGRIRYRGASQKVFETFFYWWCNVFDPNPPWMQRCFTKKWNDHT